MRSQVHSRSSSLGAWLRAALALSPLAVLLWAVGLTGLGIA